MADREYEYIDIKHSDINRRYRVFHPDDPNKVYIVANVNYYTGNNGVNEHLSTISKELQDEEATYTSDFVAGKITEKIMSTMAELGKFPLLHEFASDYVEYSDGKRELTNNIKITDGMEVAGNLRMEFGLTETKDQRGKGTEISDIQMVPTETTYQTIDRWEEAREVYPEMPFPDEALEAEDWYEVNEVFQEMKVEFGSNMSDFIHGEELGEGETIEDIEIKEE